MKQNKGLLFLVGAGILLIIIAGVAYLLLSRQGLLFRSPSTNAVSQGVEVALPPTLSELAELYPELAPVLTDSELGSVYKEFLVAYQEGGMESALQLAKERGLLTPEGDALRVMLVLDTEDPAPLVAQLNAVGVVVVSAYRDRVNIAIPVTLVETQLQSDEPGAIFAQLTELQHVTAVRLPSLRSTEQGGDEGQGVGVIDADAWHQQGITGAGLRIGVLDLGFAGYEELLGVELPDDVPLATFGWYDSEEVHGTACAEIIHEVAPDADLFFAWYDGSDAAFGEAVDWLMAQGVQIISHSAGGIVSPRDGSGWDAQLVDSLAAQGILWVNAAGNEGDVHYRDTFLDEDGNGFHEFAPGEEQLIVYNWDSYLEVYLVWEDDWDSPTQDYELFLVDENGQTLASSEEPQDGTPGQTPAEGVAFETDEEVVYIMVQSYVTDAPVTFDIFVQGDGELADPSPAYTVNSPGDAVGSLTVGAAEWKDDDLASYSSQGPTLDERLKPEISAPTGVSVATYGKYPFDGTSSSTPHVAGAAALIWQAYPQWTRQEVIDYLLEASKDLGPAGPDTGFGYGRLQLPAPPEGVAVAPFPTQEQPVPEDATLQPLPTPTSVVFVTPEVTPAPGTGREGGRLVGAVLLGVIVLGLGAVGFLLVVIAGFLWMRGRRVQKIPPRTHTGVLIPAGNPSASFSPQQDSPYAQWNVHGTPPPSAPVQPSMGVPEATSSVQSMAQANGSVQPERNIGPYPEENGSQFSNTCSVCGAPLRSGARFCAVCGSSVSTPGAASPPKTQNKPETLLSDAGHCPHCGAVARPGARFCAVCGTAIPFTGDALPNPTAVVEPPAQSDDHCLYCGAPLRPGSRFCPKCGQPVRNGMT